MKQQLFKPQLFLRYEDKLSWEDAIRLSCQTLIKYGYINEEYINAIFKTINKYGPYFILLENLALPHAKDFSAVNKSAIALTVFQQPVIFPNGKSVQVLCTLAAKDEHEHLQVLQQLSKFLQKPNIVNRLITTNNYYELQQIMEEQ